MITMDMGLARAEHLRRLRAARAPLLAELDLAWQRAMEAGNARAAKAAAARKQQLRDVTAAPEIAAAETPEDLLASLPGEPLRASYLRIMGGAP